MSTPDPYEQYRAALGAEIRRVSPAVARRQRRRRFAALGGATVALAAAATAVVVIAPTTGSKLDVIGQARAAIAPSSDGIIHYAVSIKDDQPQRRVDIAHWKGCGKVPADVWASTASGPPRYRLLMPDNHCSVSSIRGHIATGAVEFAFGDLTSSYYAPDDGFEVVTTDLPEAANDQPAPMPIVDSRFGDARDPVAQIRKMLAAGQLHDAGAATTNGKSVRRLVGTFFEKRGDPAHPHQSKVKVRYDVDATTFAPVVISSTTEQFVPKDPNLPIKPLIYVHRMVTTTVTFAKYEMLPLTPANEKLLAVDPKPGTDVHTSTYKPVTHVVKPSKAELARATKIVDAQLAAGTRLHAYGLNR